MYWSKTAEERVVAADRFLMDRYPIYNPAVMTGPKAMSFASPVENPAAACAATCTGYDFVGVQNVAMENGQVSVQCT